MSDSSKGSVLAVTGVFIPVCTIVVALRFYARYNRNIPFKSNDWCMLGALLNFLAYAACALWFIQVGWIGHGSYPFPGTRLPEEFDKTAPVIIASDIVLWIALGLVKISSLLLYASLFCVGSIRNGVQTTLQVIRVTGVIVGLWVIAASFLVGFQCEGRLKGLWQPALNAKYCSKAPTYFYAIFLSDLILDVWVMLIPIPLILRLHMNVAKKLQIAGVFMIALVPKWSWGFLRSTRRVPGSINASVNINPNDPEKLFSVIVFFNILETAMILISINMPVVWCLLAWVKRNSRPRMVQSMVTLSSPASMTEAPSSHQGGETADRSKRADPSIKVGFNNVRLVDIDTTRIARDGSSAASASEGV